MYVGDCACVRRGGHKEMSHRAAVSSKTALPGGLSGRA